MLSHFYSPFYCTKHSFAFCIRFNGFIRLNGNRNRNTNTNTKIKMNPFLFFSFVSAIRFDSRTFHHRKTLELRSKIIVALLSVFCVYLFIYFGYLFFLFIAIAAARRFKYHHISDNSDTGAAFVVAIVAAGVKTVPLDVVNEFVAIQHSTGCWHTIVYYIWDII